MFTKSQFDRASKLTNAQILTRIALGEAVLCDGIKELAGETAIKNISDQIEGLKQILRYRDRIKKKKKPEGIVIGMKPLNLFARRH